MRTEYRLPEPLPPGFSRRIALRCADLVDVAYSCYQQWSDAAKPPEARMKFAPVAYGRMEFAAPFWRTLTYRAPAARGAKSSARKYRTVVERTPAGICARDGNVLYVAFRGTLGNAEKITNWMVGKQDAVFDDLQGGGVHRGFHQCYVTVREAIMDFLETHAGPRQTIRIAGYSLGGALAVLAAMDVATSWIPHRRLEVYTFASPRVGSRKWAEHYDRQRIRTWRIANANDPITKVPFKLLGYRHVGVPIRLAALSGLDAHSLANAYRPALRPAPRLTPAAGQE